MYELTVFDFFTGISVLNTINKAVKTFHVKVSKTARYCLLGHPSEKIETVWVCCHGYGQLAPYFIRKFEVLDNGKNLIVAPEALSKFYLEGFSGRVGASWMTKEERENDIADYINYLNILMAEIKSTIKKDVKINILGFSQGVATVCRWVTHSKIDFDKLILWAGVFPPDLNKDFAFSMEKLQNKKIYIVYGDNDPFLYDDHKKNLDQYKKLFPEISVINFHGKHDIDEKVLKENFL
ncbi:MAG: alpha/beta hydrolase [Cytophagaceae bacterium]